MTDSMKFGPEWLRNMKSDTSAMGVSQPSTTATIKMAEFRYGREEMLALFDRSILPPDPTKQKDMQGLYVDKTQLPLALVQMTDDETRMWNRGINSDTALRLSKPGPGAGAPGMRGALGSRGGSVDRGRGRARGSYHYSRGLSYEESEPPNGYNPRNMRSYDRTQSWGERNGGEPGDYTATSPRKEFGTRNLPDTNWRRNRASEDKDGWLATRSDKWGRGSSNSWREGDNSWDRTNNSHPPPRKPWENDETNLPEWAMENPSESGGSFDASGAFHGGTVYSDEEEGVNHRSEHTKSQPRPVPHGHREPPNITNGTPSMASTHASGAGMRLSQSQSSKGGGGDPLRHSQSGGVTEPLRHSQSQGGGDALRQGSLRQSHSATSLARPANHPVPITSSASFSGVNSHTSHTNSESQVQREEPAVPPPHQSPVKPVQAPPPPEPQKPTQEEDIEQRLLDAADVFVSRLMDEEEREPPTAQPSTTSPPTPAPAHGQAITDTLWYYQDPQGNVQGPFQSTEMAEWFNSGYFKGTLLVRRACDERYSPLSELMKLWKGIPFMLDYYLVPPIKNTEPIMPVMDESLLMLQLQQQRLMMHRQAQTLAKLNQSEHFTSLTLEQQQMLAHQAQMEMSLQSGMVNPHSHTNSNVLAMIHQLAQFQQLQQRPGGQVPVSEAPLDPVQQLMQQMGLSRPAVPTPTPQNTTEDQRSIEQFMNAFRQRQTNPQTQPQPVTMDSVWGGQTAAFPSWSAPPGHPTAAPPPAPLWDPVAKGIKTEQEVLEEQLRAEEQKKEELRKQEELQRLKEEEEKERLRKIQEEEELERRRRQEEEEKEREKKRLQEEEERKKKEAAAAKKAEQDRLKKEEEKKRKEEEKRRKEEEKKKQEEEKKRAEEEKKKLDEERKKKEDIAKRQNEALKRLQEQQQQQQARAVKPTPAHVPAPWTTPDTAGASLADIQKTERKQQQQLREQQEMLRAYQEKHQQEQQQLKSSKSGSSLNLKWADNAKVPPTRVKSLAEIQAEEQERTAKQAEKEKAERMAAVKEVPVAATGSIWASANQSLSWSNAASVWGTTNSAVSGSGARYWDEVSTPKPTKPAKTAAQAPAAKSQAKTKAKKEEASVMKLFEKQIPKNSKSEDFIKWCTKSLSTYSHKIDIPTFVEFLWQFESHEIREYARSYLAETKEANDFATEFIDRRSRLVAADRSEPMPPPTTTTHSNHFQEVKGKNKKVKKNKMTKVDSRILGFNVTAAPDRINVGDRDYGEGL